MADVYFQGTGKIPMRTPAPSSIGSVGSVDSLKAGAKILLPADQKSDPQMSFKETLGQYFNKVNEMQNTSADFSKRLAAGEELDLHRVMIAGEQAGMAMSMTIQMRNKMVEAYQEILRMQV
jgi:flagellar hook-basal body complex protein FliE